MINIVLFGPLQVALNPCKLPWTMGQILYTLE